MKNYKDFVTEAGRCWKDYKPVPGKTPFTPGSCVKEEESIDESSDSGLAAKAEKSGVSIGTLRTVYKRGVAAWNSGHRPGTTPQQWGMARVNSYITKGKGTYHGADKDLREASEVPKDKESGLPKKYVAGLSASTAKARAAHWNKMDKKSDRDPSAYEPAPGDAGAKTKESKHTKKYRDMFGEAAVDAKRYKSSTGSFVKEDSHSLNQWKNKEPIEYTKYLIKHFGSPNELTENRAVWYNKDGFKRIEVLDEYILHASPLPHYDFVYCYVDLKVPTNLANKLAESSESIIVDFLKNEVGARCASLSANAVTLNYVFDVVESRVVPSKEKYESRIKSMKNMFSSGKKYELDWWADESGDADPNNPYYKESVNERFNHCGCSIKEAAVDAKGLKSSTGGLTQKGRDYYNRKDGGNLKAPVTTPPSKLTPGSKAANRRKSFCARMGGVEGPMKKPNGEPSRKALALRKWNC
jgi:hypothetical protein